MAYFLVRFKDRFRGRWVGRGTKVPNQSTGISASPTRRMPMENTRGMPMENGAAGKEKALTAQGLFRRAGDRGRTGDLMLGKHTL